MQSTGVSGVVVAVFLTLISVGLAFAFLGFGRETQKTLEEEVGGGVESEIAGLRTGLVISDVRANVVTVKNTGSTEIDVSKIDVLLDGKRTKTNTTVTTLTPGQTADLTLNDFVPGVRNVRVTGPGGRGDEGEFAVAPPGVVALWDFEDEDGYPDDLVGNNNGRLNGSTLVLLHFDEGRGDKAIDASNYGNNGTFKNGALWTAGIQGNAVKLDGSDDFVEVPSVNPTSAITVEAWVKSATSTGYSAVWQIVSKYNAYILGTSGTGTKDMCFIIYTTTWQYDTCYTVPDPQNWHYFVGTYDSGRREKKLYVDGVLRDTDTVSGSINADAGPINLGQRECCPGQVFNGAIDEVAVHSRVLSAAEIKERFEEKRAKFSEYTRGLTGTAVQLDGDGDRVISPDSAGLDITGPVSVETWVRADTLNNAADKALVWKGNEGGSDVTSPYALSFLTNNTFYFHVANNIDANRITSTTVLTSTTQWNHVVGTADGTNVKIYVNGVLEKTLSQTVTPYNSAFRLILGGLEANPPHHLDGAIDYVAVYSRALSASEIKSIYDAAVS